MHMYTHMNAQTASKKSLAHVLPEKIIPEFENHIEGERRHVEPIKALQLTILRSIKLNIDFVACLCLPDAYNAIQKGKSGNA